MDKKLVFLAVFAIQLIAAFTSLDVRWDEAVYIMNSRYFSGEHVYLEVIRPPILPILLMPFNWSLMAMRLFYAALCFATCYLAYMICVEFKKPRAGLIAMLLLATNPLFFYWSHWIYSEIPSLMFSLASILLFMRFRKRDLDKDLYLAFFMASMAFLTKYTSGILLPAILIMLLIEKKLDRRMVFGLAIFLLPILPWLWYNFMETGDFFYTFVWGLKWPSSMTTDFWYYFTSLPVIFSAQIVLLPLAFVKKGRKHLPLIIFPLLLFLFYQLFSYKETRYFVQIVPFLLILVSLEFRKKWVKYLLPIFITGLIMGHIYVIPNLSCGQDAFSKIGVLEGRSLSVAWPINAYYSKVNVKAFPENPEEFQTFLDEFNITYIIASDAYGWPEYAMNQSFFSGYVLQKETSDSCKRVWVYSVQKT
jgi:4-amino-4-deoxy-L-arabinose transferase-like glycosyltransferase